MILIFQQHFTKVKRGKQIIRKIIRREGLVRKRLLPILVCSLLAFVLGCGHSQQLVSITVTPPVETFGAANIPVSEDHGLNVQLRALGNYIHPPVTKDITDQVVWTSNTPQMVTVNSTGLIEATGEACGGAVISATVTTNNSGAVSSSGAIVTGTMAANVVCYTGNLSIPSLPITAGY